MRRRTFITASLGGTLVLAAGGVWWKKKYGTPARNAVFTPESRLIFAALIPAIIGAPGGKPLSSAQINAAVERVLETISGLPLVTQDEIGELLSLLQIAAVRKLLAVSAPWTQATPQELATFLQSWRTHSVSLLQSGYLALHDLTTGAYYAAEDTWAMTGYPGPAIRFA
jgi:hypothetical protein